MSRGNTRQALQSGVTETALSNQPGAFLRAVEKTGVEPPKTRLPVADADGIRLYSADELAAALGQSKRWVYRQVDERSLPAIKLGRSLVFQLPAVTAWLERQRVGQWDSAVMGDER